MVCRVKEKTFVVNLFDRVMTSVHESYNPEVIVCQCGTDGLAGDPMSSFNLTQTAYCHCLYFLLQWKLPLLLLGGGGLLLVQNWYCLANQYLVVPSTWSFDLILSKIRNRVDCQHSKKDPKHTRD